MGNNINVINFKKRGSVDLGFYDEEIAFMKYTIEMYDIIKQLVKDATDETVRESGLEHVDFVMCNDDDLDLLFDTSFVGDDDEYDYQMDVSISYPTEDEIEEDDIEISTFYGGSIEVSDDESIDEEMMPTSIFIFVVRRDKKSGCVEKFNFPEGRWEEAELEDQIEMINKEDMEDLEIEEDE